MEVGQLQKRLVDLRSFLFREGILDDHFSQLQQLQDESSPDFVCEVVTLFFEDAQKLLDDLGRALDQQPVEYQTVGSHVHQLKGSSSNIGAARVKNVCMAFRTCCDQRNREGCLICLQQVKYELALVKGKIETLLKMEKQIVAAGGSIPVLGF